MAINTYKPTTPGRRATSVNRHQGKKTKKRKHLHSAIRKKAGRNNQGRITVRHRGGGAKRSYRQVDYLREKFDVPGKVVSIEYDPNRSARIAYVIYKDGDRRYIIAPYSLKVGDFIMSSRQRIDIKIGNNMPLKFIPVGQTVHSIELNPGSGAKLARSAGNSAVLMGVEGNYAQLKMPSTEVRLVPAECRATIGETGNKEHANVRVGKAGRVRHLGIRPTVRGKVMNPVDHPHGGGEGRQPIGLKHPKTPWGKPALGVKTRRSDKSSDRLILRRRKTKKRK